MNVSIKCKLNNKLEFQNDFFLPCIFAHTAKLYYFNIHLYQFYQIASKAAIREFLLL